MNSLVPGGRNRGRRPARGSAAALSALSLIAALGCQDVTSPSRAVGGVKIVAGGGQTDTVLAVLPQALVVQIRDSAGALAASEIVRFQSVPIDSLPYTPAVWVGALSSAYYGTFLAESTDARGEAAALIQLGSVAGPARVAVSVPRFGYRDTVTFTVLPGAAARIVLRDTALYVGRSGPLDASVADRFGNRRDEAVTFQSLDPAVATVTGAGVATAVAIGLSRIAVQSASPHLVDTLHVSVVPQGTIAAMVGGFRSFPFGTIVTMNLDGSSAAAIPESAGDNYYLQWFPSRSGILFFRPGYLGHVASISLAGVFTQLVPSTAGFEEDNWARLDAGGAYVYFRGVKGSGIGLWRIRPNGTGLDSVPVGSGTQPAPSPDGTRVAYSAADGFLHVYDYSTTSDTQLGVRGYAPHWSPDGAWIAYVPNEPGPIFVVKPDGSAGRQLGSGASYDWSFDWSPDNNWIVAGAPYGGGPLTLIQVQTGIELPLGYTAGLTRPTWKP